MQGMGVGAPPSDPTEFNLNSQRSAYHGRYVDLKYEPIPADVVKNVIIGDVLPETNLELIVAKRIPFRIALKMDERKINDFVAACANSEFVFEVKQYRINRHIANDGIQFKGGASKVDVGVSGGAGGMGGPGMGMGGPGMGKSGPGMGGGMGAGMGGPGMGMGGPGMGGGLSVELDDLVSTTVESRTNHDVDVEFYGIIKIYNPVREDFLRKAAGQQIDAAADEDPDDTASWTPEQKGKTEGTLAMANRQ